MKKGPQCEPVNWVCWCVDGLLVEAAAVIESGAVIERDAACERIYLLTNRVWPGHQPAPFVAVRMHGGEVEMAADAVDL